MAEHSSTNISGGHTNAVASGAAGFMSGADKAKLDGIATGADVTSANNPKAHSATHVGGSDPIAVATGAVAGLMSAADKTKLDGLAPAGPGFSVSWGTVAAPATASARFFQRTAAAVAATFTGGTYPSSVAGSRTVYITWNVSGTALVTDTVTLTLFINGVASALTVAMGPGAVSGQASATLTLAVGDSLAIRTVQSSTEAQAAWHGSVTIST